jgi:glycosyltransferase involved in cell wall biosynthesis
MYWFNIAYPSVFKPYFDAQLAAFEDLGATVTPFALMPGPQPWSEVCRSRALDRRVKYLGRPGSSRIAQAVEVFRAFRTPGGARIRGGLAAWRGAGSPRRRIAAALRAVALPGAGPNLLFVNNLKTLCQLPFLRRLYPGVPLAFYYHGGEPAGGEPVSPQETAEAIQAADVIFTNTSFSAGHIVARGADPGRVEVSPLGFLTEHYPMRPPRVRQPGQRLELISIGRLSAEKGHHVALDAAARLVSMGRRLRYRLVGSGPERSRLERHAESLGLGDTIDFLGAVDDAVLRNVVKDADVALQPSLTLGDWTENQAYAVQELQLWGVPVIATRSGGMPECIAPSLRSLMPREGDPIGLADAVDQVVGLSPDAYGEVVREGRAFVEEHFDARRLTRGMLERIGRA